MNNKILSSSMWSISSELIAKVIGPLGFIILTNVLSPNDFGIVTIASTILGFVYIVSDLGIGKVIIQETSDKIHLDYIYNGSFWINALMGMMLASLMFLFSDNLALIFGNVESSSVIKVMAIQAVFYSLSALQLADRKKKFDFKFLFYLRLITVAAPLLISLPFAFAGWGYWAIVWGQVLGAASSTLFLWIKSDWKPSINISFVGLKDILIKSGWNSIEQIFIWIPIALDTYFISKNLSLKELGMYSTSKTLFTTTISLTLGAIMPVLYSHFSNIKFDEIRFKTTLLFSQKVIFFLSSFLGLVVFIYSDLIERIIFNNKWQGISSVFGIMFLILGFEYFFAALVEGLRSKGYFRITALNSIGVTLISIPILFYSISLGLIVYVVVRSTLLLLIAPTIFYFSKKYIKIGFYDCLLNCKYILFSIFLVLISNFFTDYFFDTFIGLRYLINAVILGFSFFILYYFEKEEILKVKKMILHKNC